MSDEILQDNDFYIWQPSCVDIVKSGAGERRIGGYCSTEHMDRQQEVVLQRGLDFDELLKYGYYNDNHNQATAAVVGVPERAEYRAGKGWYTEGYLLKGLKRADEIWELAKSLETTPRKLGFSIEGKVLERRDNYIVKAKIRNIAVTNAPVNTNCFPGNVRVSGRAELIYRRFYVGRMVEVELETGEKVSGTPNHPVLTNVGWVTLGELDKLKHRVGCSIQRVGSALGEPSHDVDDVPTTLEQAYRLACIVSSGKRVDAGSAEQFHGDGRDGDVNIVNIDGELKRTLNTSFTKEFGKGLLAASELGQRALSGGGFSNKLLVGTFGAPSCLVSRQGVDSSLCRAESVISDLGGGTGLPNFNAGVSENATDGMAVTAKAFGDGHCAFSVSIQFSKITSVREYDFSGHVYNLQTEHSWYSANGIVAHNCTWGLLAKSFCDFNKSTSPRTAVIDPLGLDPGKVTVTDGEEVGEIKCVHPCLQCDKAFSDAPSLEAHAASKHGKKTRKSVQLSEEEGLALIHRVRPHYSDELCRKIFKFACKGE